MKTTGQCHSANRTAFNFFGILLMVLMAISVANSDAQAQNDGRSGKAILFFEPVETESGDAWMYAERVRYRFAETNVNLQYRRELSKVISIRFVASSDLRFASDRYARTELVWRFN